MFFGNVFFSWFFSQHFFVFRHGNDSTACRGVGRRRKLIPPFLKLDGTPLRMSTSCRSLDRSRGRSDSRRLGLLGGGSLSGLAGFLGGSSLSGSLLSGGLSLVLLLGRGFLVVELHGLAGLAEKTAELVALGLGLAVGALIVRVTLLLAEVTEERGATLVLAGRSLGSGGLSGSLLGASASVAAAAVVTVSGSMGFTAASSTGFSSWGQCWRQRRSQQEPQPPSRTSRGKGW
ncbi:uncharacterized protein P174DRAFT_203015 [Aspergillus novofumigatus IBT 16806]|uniref:Uncharacterized protein n=1 Tax=Aspergillus novofumigatus (strain IBT 16806) TaxID=1392255 RepID=A0A2I1C4M8_ASPN1|nr:uncharacterized protein P174DRAFT_203015 [Aspergillus novofumigatus IBT 16806]PKX92541.1 hypothetical protein P174DRAFT_203015 [Aspergillus novofumigatus IBT 16806]